MSAAPQQTVGAIDVAPDHQIRLTFATEKGKRVIDLRAFDKFAGVWMPTKAGVSLPVEHLAALHGLTTAALNMEGVEA